MSDFEACRKFLLEFQVLDWDASKAEHLVNIFRKMSDSDFLKSLTVEELEELITLQSSIVASFQFEPTCSIDFDFSNLNSGPKIS